MSSLSAARAEETIRNKVTIIQSDTKRKVDTIHLTDSGIARFTRTLTGLQREEKQFVSEALTIAQFARRSENEYQKSFLCGGDRERAARISVKTKREGYVEYIETGSNRQQQDEQRTKSESADSSVSTLTSGVCQQSQMSNLDEELSSQLLVKVAGAVSHRWQEFGARLSADMFPTKRTDVITDKYREPFLRAQAMLEEWREAMGRRATCDLIAQTLLKMGLRKEACDIFGYDVVELIYPNK